MNLDEALAEATWPVLALAPGRWVGPVLAQVAREGTFGASPTVSDIQLHYLDRSGGHDEPTKGVLVANRLKPTTWARDRRIYEVEPLSAQLENFVARFTGIDPRPPLQTEDMAPLDVEVPYPNTTASRHRTLPLEVVAFSVDPDAPLGVEACIATWRLPVAHYLGLLAPLTPETARMVDRGRLDP